MQALETAYKTQAKKIRYLETKKLTTLPQRNHKPPKLPASKFCKNLDISNAKKGDYNGRWYLDENLKNRWALERPVYKHVFKGRYLQYMIDQRKNERGWVLGHGYGKLQAFRRFYHRGMMNTTTYYCFSSYVYDVHKL